MKAEEAFEYLFYGVLLCAFLAFLYVLYVRSTSSNVNVITIRQQEGSGSVTEEEQTLLTEWDGSSGCKPGFTRQSNLCIKQCYEHPSLADLYKRPNSRPNNAIAQFGVDDRWENISSTKDYCYMCPSGYSRGSYDETTKKMSCVANCPNGMADNPMAETCYRGYLACSPSDSIEQCQLVKCSPGYTRKTNSVGQAVCVKNDMGCPAGMRNNPEYLGCWKSKINATISTVEDMYPLTDLGSNIM